ncbi:hypothetical protein EXIGLDRAFT_732102 [Exidia glandulosa HHB12029]|uniref:Extracellular metalloproteinase n=1 Tax=Exidia glandulosa HHB12029 TaxID=1314781 RepID=A0A165BMJ6_EXIGL|nr:hypothetical protein EXIGLDRAFT_732102 [Exidia glandulosa HHB12029]
MVSLTPAFLTLAVYCTSALAAPYVQSSKHVTHRVRTLPNGLQVRSYHPESTYKTFPEGVKPPVSANGLAANFKASALSYIHQELGEENVQYTSGYTSPVASHHYVNQHFNGIPVVNAVAHSSLNKDGNVVAFSSSFVTGKPNVAPATPSISKEDALEAVKTKLGATPTDREIKLEYFASDDGSVILSHVVEAHIDDNGHLVEAFINAHTGELASLLDYTLSLTYLALPIQKQAPTEGIETIVNPEDLTASPNGWTVLNGTDTKTTSGNNGVVYKTSESSTTKESSTDTFNYPWAPGSQASVAANVDAARTNAFYILNTVHDISYRYGFTESAFNFQNDNFGKGGKGGDRVTVSVQDSADFGTYNADFSVTPDGTSGHMRMFLWDITTIRRDGALENDIVVHEFTHGISNRMTGGGTGRCLTTTEAGGMGEGWSDAFAEWTEQKDSTVPDFTMGAYVINDAAGIRSLPYSTSKTVNPYTYATIATKNEVHDIGEIWANTLHNVYAALVEANGFSADAKTNPDATGGNAIFLHLFIDSFPLQPCNPTFPTARDAWIQADVNRFAGANKCTLWKAFASRGLGVGAANHKDSTDIPAECNGTSTPTSTVSSTTTRSTSTLSSTSTRSTSTSSRTSSTSTRTSSTSTRSTSTRTTSTRTPTPTPTPEPEPECPWWWPFDFCF